MLCEDRPANGQLRTRRWHDANRPAQTGPRCDVASARCRGGSSWSAAGRQGASIDATKPRAARRRSPPGPARMSLLAPLARVPARRWARAPPQNAERTRSSRPSPSNEPIRRSSKNEARCFAPLSKRKSRQDRRRSRRCHDQGKRSVQSERTSAGLTREHAPRAHAGCAWSLDAPTSRATSSGRHVRTPRHQRHFREQLPTEARASGLTETVAGSHHAR